MTTTHELNIGHSLLRDPNTAQLFTAVPVPDKADCSKCFFRNRRCPVTSTGCAACTPDVRNDEKTIVWQVLQ